MIIKEILPFSHQLLKDALTRGRVAVDATAGNGHDTAFLAEHVGEKGHVYAFDIQQTAIEKTKARLFEKGLHDRATVFHSGHERLQSLIPENVHGTIQASVFNLGYLPGGEKDIVTTPETTIAAIKQLLDLSAVGGIIVLVIYHGHPEGEIERDHVMTFIETLPQEHVHVLRYEFMNRNNNPPFLIALEKR